MRLFALMVLLTATPAAFAQAPAQSAPASVPDQKNGFSGKVTQTMNAGDYTYVEIDTGTKKLWAASPRFAVKVGDQAQVQAGMPMEKYHSKILDRDFDIVYFTDRVVVNGKGATAGQTPALPEGHPAIPGAAGMPAGHPPIAGAGAARPERAKVDLTGIKKAEGGKTVAEIFAQKTVLKGKKVSVRGKVVKFNANIMNRNWVHIKDGTGTYGTDDLLVTTDKTFKIGDTVLVTGKLTLDKDFGANYKYDVMIEDGTITAE